jgi:NTP pyrophosphatase (non-canonical NTP hydrolase)
VKTLNYQRVIEWARQRGILDQSTAQFQMLKATEEHGEMAGAILRGDRDELVDSIGDQLVVAIVQCAQLGYGLELREWCNVVVDPEWLAPGLPFDYGTEYGVALAVTAAQGGVSGDIARSRCARKSFGKLFREIFNLCHVFGVNPAEALDSVYDIISKRGGEMRNGVWVKTEDL